MLHHQAALGMVQCEPLHITQAVALHRPPYSRTAQLSMRSFLLLHPHASLHARSGCIQCMLHTVHAWHPPEGCFWADCILRIQQSDPPRHAESVTHVSQCCQQMLEMEAVSGRCSQCCHLMHHSDTTPKISFAWSQSNATRWFRQDRCRKGGAIPVSTQQHCLAGC